MLTIIAFFSLFYSVSITHATTNIPPQSGSNVVMEFPSIAINSIIMKEYVYTPGSNIELKVDLENVSKSPNQFTQSVVLYENNLSSKERRIIDIRRFEETSLLNPGDRINKNIVYSVPSFVRGDLILSFILEDTSGRSINRKEIFINQIQEGGVVPELIAPSFKNSIQSATIEQKGNVNADNGISSASIDLQKTLQDDPVVFNDSDDFHVRVAFNSLSASNTIEVKYGNTIVRKLAEKEEVFKIKPIRGNNLFTVSVYDDSNKLAAPIIAKEILVQGIEGIIQAFGIENNGKAISEVKKGDILRVYLNWVPQVFAFNQTELLSNPIFNSPFTAHIYLYDQEGKTQELIGSSTLQEVGVHVVSDIKVAKSSKFVGGKVVIFSGDYKVVEYEKVLISSQQVSNTNYFNSKIIISVCLLLIAVIAAWYVIRMRKARQINSIGNNQSGKIRMYIIFAFLLSSFVLPSTVHAQWQAISSGVLNHYYPRDTDSSTTTWRSVLVSGSPNYYASAFSRSCPANTVLTGATSNYVSIDNPMISGNGKTYRWEYTWLPTRNSGTSVFNLPNWFSLQEQYSGSGSGYRYPTYPNRDARPVIPSTNLYSQSAFIDKKAFDRSAQVSDNMFSTWNSTYSTGWNKYRPFRFSLSPSLHSALATSTYSNLNSWLEARFNAFDRRVDNISDSGLGYLNYSLLSSMIPGSYVAASGRLFYSIFSNPFNFTSATTTSLLQSTGYTDTDLLFNFDAGSFISDYTPGQGNTGIGTSFSSRLGAYPEYGATSSRLDCIAPYNSTSCKNFERSYLEGTYSRPGTYNLMNILVTSRLGSIVPMNFDGRGGYQCQSNNSQVFNAPYEIIDNSYIAVVMFYDENADGIKQPNEKSIVSADSFSEGFATSTNNGLISRNHGLTNICPVATIHTINRKLPFYYATSTSQIAKMYEEKILSTSPWYQYIAPVPYVRTDTQVVNPTYLRSFSTTSPSLRINNVSIGGYQTVDTPTYWIQNSGMGGFDYTREYDSQGRLILRTTNQNCGHTTLISNSLGIVSSGTSTLTAEEFSKQTSMYPMSSDVANTNIAYSKFAINSELSSSYTVGIDPATLSSGWTRTKESSAPSFEKTVLASGGNQNYTVYLGVTYSSPGVCGSATSTTAQTTTPPSTNLCSAGSSTEVISNNQNFSWSCNGIGSNSTNASCEKPKCPASNPFYCAATNACVASNSECTIAGVCGSATSYAGQISEGPAVVPSANLCSAGTLNGIVADGGASSFVWTCAGINGGVTSPTCSQPKCSSAAGLRYCASVNECRTSCGTVGTSTLILNSKLNPWVVRDRNSSCTLTWRVSASDDLPVECTLNGTPMGPKSSTIQRSAAVPVGRSTLSCKNDEVEQSTTTRCLLNPSFQEI